MRVDVKERATVLATTSLESPLPVVLQQWEHTFGVGALRCDAAGRCQNMEAQSAAFCPQGEPIPRATSRALLCTNLARSLPL